MPLYEEIAEHLNITVDTLKRRLVKGEPLVQAYYEWKYNWDPKNDNEVPF